MKTSSIAEAKNNLSNLIHQLEKEKTIHLTRYGKPVAVIMSESQYKALLTPTNSISSAIMDWRSQFDDIEDISLDDNELKTIRKESSGREFSWEK